MQAALPANETERLQALWEYDILDTLPEQAYQDIVNLASLICEVPIAIVSLVDRDRQWFKAKVGLEASQTERSVAFCNHALHHPDKLLIVPDATLDLRFERNPLVTEQPNIRFYAGAPLTTRNGLVLGTLCVLDRTARNMNERQQEALFALSRQVMAQLEHRQKIRQLQEAQAQLVQAEKLSSIGQLAAGVAHEINNPVGFVSSNMSTLRSYTSTLFGVIDRYRNVLDHETISVDGQLQLQELTDYTELSYIKNDMTELVSESMEGLDRVRDIVQALKAFCPPGEIEWQFSDLHEGLDNTLKIVSGELTDKTRIVRDYGVLPAVKCLLGQMNQVFMNLILNAVYAIDKTGVITIRTRVENGWVQIEISDTGCGIAEQNLKLIFDPFFTTKPVGVGTGLGLSVCYNIVKRHGGRIEVDSVVGVGTKFLISLPVTPPEALL